MTENDNVINLGSVAAARARASMCPALVEHFEAMAHLFARDDMETVVARYEIGVRVRAVMNGGAAYGDEAVPRVALALHRKKTQLYAFARVPRCWSPKTVRGFLERRTVRGRTLSHSHLLEISRAKSKVLRAQFIEEVFRDDLGVRETRLRVAGTTQAASLSPVDQARGTLAQLGRAMTTVAAVRDRIATHPGSSPTELEALLLLVETSRRLARDELDALVEVIQGRLMCAAESQATASGELSIPRT